MQTCHIQCSNKLNHTLNSVMSGALSYLWDERMLSSLIGSPVSIHSSAMETEGSRSWPSVEKDEIRSSWIPAIASQATLSDGDNPELFLFLSTSFGAFFSAVFLGVHEKALRASFCKLLRLLVKDDRGGTTDLVFGFGLDPDTDIWCSLGGEQILTAMALVAYAVITLLSRKEGNSFNIYRK